MRFSLEGKVAIVTGASRGTGRGIALGFAEQGADLVLAARTVRDLEDLRRAVEALGRRAVVVETDLLDVAQAGRPVDAAIAELGRVDVLVNNAGGDGLFVDGGSESLLGVPIGAMWQLMTLDVVAPAAITKAAAEVMKESGGGSIINVTSMVACVPRGHLHAYAASKAAMEAFTTAWAESLEPHGIRVNAFAPDGVVCGNPARFVDADEKAAAVTAKIQTGRVGEPMDAADCAIFLASDESSWITGASLLLSGGRLW